MSKTNLKNKRLRLTYERFLHLNHGCCARASMSSTIEHSGGVFAIMLRKSVHHPDMVS